MGKIKIKKDDKVVVIAGEHKGSMGRVIKVINDQNKVIVEGVNVIKKHSKLIRQRFQVIKHHCRIINNELKVIYIGTSGTH